MVIALSASPPTRSSVVGFLFFLPTGSDSRNFPIFSGNEASFSSLVALPGASRIPAGNFSTADDTRVNAPVPRLFFRSLTFDSSSLVPQTGASSDRVRGARSDQRVHGAGRLGLAEDHADGVDVRQS